MRPLGGQKHKKSGVLQHRATSKSKTSPREIVATFRGGSGGEKNKVGESSGAESGGGRVRPVLKKMSLPIRGGQGSALNLGGGTSSLESSMQYCSTRAQRRTALFKGTVLMKQIKGVRGWEKRKSV